jgi:hypothetical protein
MEPAVSGRRQSDASKPPLQRSPPFQEDLMNRRSTAKIVGAAAALVTGPAVAATPPQAQPVPVARSYAELLQPIGNPVERLAAADAQAPEPRLLEAQYVAYHHHHHHHHHHWRHSRAWYLRNGYYWNNGGWMLRPRRHHHHHHHHHHNYY